MLGISYWIVPIFSSTVWTAMLIAMLAYWAATGKPHYVTMSEGQYIPYISDIGADTLKPMFIAMSAVTVVTFDLAFIFERYLRHSGRLTPNTSKWQKIYSTCSIVAAIVGAAGLILLTIFDCKHHDRLHNIFLAVFIIGYIVSAIFICWEYQRLGIHYRQHSVLRISFWIKLFFIISEVALAIAFGVCSKIQKWNVAAVLEWVVAFVYCFYVLSFFIDFLPAVRTKDGHEEETEMQMAEEQGPGGVARDDAEAGRYYGRGHGTHTNGLTNGHTNGHANSHTNGYTSEYTNGNGMHPGYPKPAQPLNGAAHNF